MNQFLTFIFLSVFMGCAPLTQPKPVLESKPPKNSNPLTFFLQDALEAERPTTPVRYKSKVQPIYPETASQAKKGGEVIIELTVDENGLPTDIKPLTKLGYGLEECVIDAIKKTTFYPAKRGSKPIAKQIEVKYRFSYETTEDK